MALLVLAHPSPAPPGFTALDAATVGHRRASRRSWRQPPPTPPAPVPTLVPVGTTDQGTELLVELESGGVVTVDGPPGDVAGLLRAIVVAAVHRRLERPAPDRDRRPRARTSTGCRASSPPRRWRMRSLLAEAHADTTEDGAPIAALPDGRPGSGGRGDARGVGPPRDRVRSTAGRSVRAPPARRPCRPPERHRWHRRRPRRSTPACPAAGSRSVTTAGWASTESTSPCGPDTSVGREVGALVDLLAAAGQRRDAGRPGRRGGRRRRRPRRPAPPPPAVRLGRRSGGRARDQKRRRRRNPAARGRRVTRRPPRPGRTTPGAVGFGERASRPSCSREVDVLVRVLGEVTAVRLTGPEGQGEHSSPRGSGRWRRWPTWRCARPPSTARTSRSACFPTAPTRPKTVYNTVSSARTLLGDDLFPPPEGGRYELSAGRRHRLRRVLRAGGRGRRDRGRPRSPPTAAPGPQPGARRAVHRGGPQLRVGRAAPRHDRRPGGRRRRGARRGAPRLGRLAIGRVGRPPGSPGVPERRADVSAAHAHRASRRKHPGRAAGVP